MQNACSFQRDNAVKFEKKYAIFHVQEEIVEGKHILSKI